MDKRKKMLFIGGAAAAAVLIIVIILCFVLSGSGRKYEKYYDAAELAFLQGDYEEAIESCEKAMDIELTEECYLLMAEAYHASGDTDMAVQVLYLGYTRVGGEAIEKRLEELKSGEASTKPDEDGEEDDENSGRVTIGGKEIDPAVKSLLLADKGLTDSDIAPLEELKSGESSPKPDVDGEEDDEKPGRVTIGGKEIDPAVKSLLLADKGLTDSDIAPLEELTGLESLSLSGNSIIDISPLKSLEKLNFLQISDNRIKDLSPLAGLTELKTLYLDNNPVTDFEALHGLSALRTLSMKGVGITEEQLEALQEALPDCSIFTDIEDDGVEDITIGGKTFQSDVTELDLRGLGLTDISELAKCTELVKLDLRDNSISDISALIDLQKLEWLCLWNNKVSDLRPLMTLSKLKHLDVDNNLVEDLSALEYITSLEALWLSGNPVDDIEVLPELPNLRRLGLKNTGLTDEDLDILIKMTALTELTIEDNPKLTANKFEELEAALTKCEISHSELLYVVKYGDSEYKSDAESISAIGLNISDISELEHFTNLRTLILNGNLISDISPLKAMSKLEALDLYGNAVTDISPLSGLTALRSLNLMDNSISSIAPLSGLTGLTELHLSYNSVTDLGPLSGLVNLTDLDLDGNGITGIERLSSLVNLTNLSLEDNSITDLSPLYGLTKLKTLYIRGNSGLSAGDIRLLQAALPGCLITTDVDLTEPTPPLETTVPEHPDPIEPTPPVDATVPDDPKPEVNE